MIGSYFNGQLSFTYTPASLFGNLYKKTQEKNLNPVLTIFAVFRSEQILGECFSKFPSSGFFFFWCISRVHPHRLAHVQNKYNKNEQIQSKYNTKQIQCKSNTSQINTNQWTSTKPPPCFSPVFQPIPFPSQDVLPTPL